MFDHQVHAYLRTMTADRSHRIGPFLAAFDDHDGGLFRNYAIPDDDAHLLAAPFPRLPPAHATSTNCPAAPSKKTRRFIPPRSPRRVCGLYPESPTVSLGDTVDPDVLDWRPDASMTSEPRYLEFQSDRADEVVAVMTAVSEAGKGWVNFEPAVDVDDVPPEGSGAFALFSGRGPVVPLGTWTPGSTSRRGRTEPAMLGLQHPAGSKAKSLLAERGHAVPDGWTVMQDHVRRGLVVGVPADVGPGAALRWLLGAAGLLSTIPLTGTWRATVYSG